MKMRYSPEQHMKSARYLEQKANATKDPQRKADFKESAENHRAVARAAWKLSAKSLTQTALAKAAMSARLSSGPTFDVATYAEALPFFKAALRTSPTPAATCARWSSISFATSRRTAWTAPRSRTCGPMCAGSSKTRPVVWTDRARR